MSDLNSAIPLQEAVEAIQSSLQSSGAASIEHVARLLGSAATTVVLTPRSDEAVGNIASCNIQSDGAPVYWVPGI